jgi:UDP-3-O-[3-hydroxymyristoyl] glucosamine N-acyltransferase
VQGHITIGGGARVGGQAGVTGSVPAGETWSGYPARPHKEALRTSAALQRLAALVRPLERVAAREEAEARQARAGTDVAGGAA